METHKKYYIVRVQTNRSLLVILKNQYNKIKNGIVQSLIFNTLKFGSMSNRTDES